MSKVLNAGLRRLACAAALLYGFSFGWAQSLPPKLPEQAGDPNFAKVDSKLLKLGEQLSAKPSLAVREAVRAVPDASLFALDASQKAVLVEVICPTLDDNVLRKFALPGVEVVGYYPKYKRVTLAVSDLSELKAIAAIPEVGMVIPVYKPWLASQGAADSRADRALKANGLPIFGIDGSGVMVGVLSDSFAWTSGVRDTDTLPGAGLAGTLTNAKPQKSDDLPSTVALLRDDLPGNDEGAAMAELIHDVAPAASIAFHTASGGEAQMAQGIGRLRSEAGAKVIVDDVIYYREPMYQDGIVAQAAADAVRNGAAYFSAAGNAGNLAIRTNYRDVNRRQSEAKLPPTGVDLHDWGGGNPYLPIRFGPSGGSVTVVLQWNQPFYSLNPVPGKSGSRIDLDMYLLNSPDPAAFSQPLAQSREGQGTNYLPLGDPVEIFSYTGGPNQTAFLAIDHFQGSTTKIPQDKRTPLEFRVVFFVTGNVQVQGIPDATSVYGGPTMYGHALADGVISVAAIPWWEALYPVLYGPTTEIDAEPFTARGGSFRILFDSFGKVLRKPRTVNAPTLAAVDGCNTTFFGSSDLAVPAVDGEPDGYPNFFGTSAAAPNAAAVGALLKQATPSLTPADLRTRLVSTAIDVKGFRAAPGWDDVTGAGLIDAGAAASAGGGGFNFINLKFFKPSTWSSPLVVNQTLNSPNDEPNFVTGKPVYVNYAIVNEGNIASGAFTVQVLVDNVVVNSIAYPTGLGAGAQSTQTNISVGALAAGPHTIRVVVDALNQVTEQNETDNEQSRTISVGAPPANNNFANAMALGTCPTSPITGSNRFADKEVGEPSHGGNIGGASIWYAWQSPNTANPIRVKIDTIGSGFDTLLGVYTGASVNALTYVAGSDDIVPGSNVQSSVEFEATPNTLYAIAVDGKNGAQGNVVLNLSVSATNDNFAQAALLSGASGSVSGLTICASKEAGEPNHAGNAGGHSVWFHWTAPRSGAALFTTQGSRFDTLLSVYTGASLSSLTLVGENDDVGGGATYSSVTFPVSAGVDYYIALDGKNGDAGNYQLSYSAGASNDFFGAPMVLPTVCDGFVTSTNVGAGVEPNEPAHAGNPGGASVWFLWTAPVTGDPTYPVTFNTSGSDFDTLLGVYEGTSINSVSLLGFNDNARPDLSPNTKTSQLSFIAEAGKSYYILVDGVQSGSTVAQGNIILSWDVGYAPENDFLGKPTYFPSLEAANGTTNTATIDIPRTNNGASREAGEPNHAMITSGMRSVWFTFTVEDTPLVDEDVRLVTIEIDTNTPQVGCYPVPFDPVVAVYTGGPGMAQLAPYAFNDDIVPGVNTNARVVFLAPPGKYYIAVDGKNATSGNFRFKATNQMAPTGLLHALRSNPSAVKQLLPTMLGTPELK
ncbi:MAG: CARDB domain-containing protein [Candidatus Sumerlaeaceae bacterium]